MPSATTEGMFWETLSFAVTLKVQFSTLPSLQERPVTTESGRVQEWCRHHSLGSVDQEIFQTPLGPCSGVLAVNGCMSEDQGRQNWAPRAEYGQGFNKHMGKPSLGYAATPKKRTKQIPLSKTQSPPPKKDSDKKEIKTFLMAPQGKWC